MAPSVLRDCRVLIVEDDHLLALDLRCELAEAGAVVLGPVPSVGQALALIADEQRIDAAVLDMNLGGEMAYRVADALVARGVPFVLTTGYEGSELDAAYAGVPRCAKPFRALDVAGMLLGILRASALTG